MTDMEQDLSAGVGYIDGEYHPTSDVKIPISDLGFMMSDVIHDAAHVWKGSFFRLDDHLDRFERSVAGLHMTLQHSRAEIVDIVMECVRLSGLRDSLVYLIATRGVPPAGRRDLRTCTNRFIAIAYPFRWHLPLEQMETGAHVVISSVLRIPPESVDPTIKNFNRLDFSRALFEAYNQGSEYPLLLDHEGNIKAEFGIIKPDDLRAADEAFLTSSAGGIMPITKVDDKVIGNGSPGPLTLRLKDLYWALHDEPKYSSPVAYD